MLRSFASNTRNNDCNCTVFALFVLITFIASWKWENWDQYFSWDGSDHIYSNECAVGSAWGLFTDILSLIRTGTGMDLGEGAQPLSFQNHAFWVDPLNLWAYPSSWTPIALSFMNWLISIPSVSEPQIHPWTGMTNSETAERETKFTKNWSFINLTITDGGTLKKKIWPSDCWLITR